VIAWSTGIADRLVLDAMRRVPRERFVAPGFEEFAYEDAPLPIDEGQTISQPYIVGHCSLIPISYSEESMRFRRAAIECSRAALIDGQVNVLRWRAPEADPQFGAPQILMLSQLEEDGHSF
jgi:DNA-directed RNA polymerase specialized sigma24 family protein